jgi:hypothetical protein
VGKSFRSAGFLITAKLRTASLEKAKKEWRVRKIFDVNATLERQITENCRWLRLRIAEQRRAQIIVIVTTKFSSPLRELGCRGVQPRQFSTGQALINTLIKTGKGEI